MGEKIWRPDKQGRSPVWTLILTGLLFLLPGVLRAYHPMSTDDPGTTEFRSFELESGADLISEEGQANIAPGYTMLHIGLAPRLEVDFTATYNFWGDEDFEQLSGWGDAEAGIKYRFLGDGEGPFNLGAEMNFTLPSGDSDKGLSAGDTVISEAILFGTVGKDNWRVLLNAGSTFAPDFRTSYLAGVGLEYSFSEKLVLAGELFGTSDFNDNEDERVESLETLAGFYWSPREWFNLSAGDSFGLAGEAPDNRFSAAVHFCW